MTSQGPINSYSYSGANFYKKDNTVKLNIQNIQPASYNTSKFTRGYPKNKFVPYTYDPNYNPYVYYYKN